jgi:SPP1 gp7 family putative phage head morphogenesis protein
MEQIRCVIQSRYQGPSKAGRPLLLHSGIDYKPTSWSPNDILLDKVLYFSAYEICAALDVPPLLVGILEKSSYANMEQASLNFYDTVVQTRAKKIARHFSRYLCDRFQPGTKIIVDTSGIRELAENLAEKFDNALKLLGQGYTIDEVNERLDLDMPETGDDTRWIAPGLRSLENATAAPVSPFGGSPGEDDQDDQEPDDEPADEAEGEPEKAFKRIHSKRKQPNPVRVATWERQVRPFARIESRIRNAVKQYYRELKPAMLAVLDKESKKSATLKRDKPKIDPDSLIEALMAVIGTKVDPLWGRIVNYVNLGMATGILQTAEEVPLRVRTLLDLGLDENAAWGQVADAIQERLKPKIAKYLDEHQLQIVQTEVRGPLRKHLADTLTEGITDGDGWDKLSVRVKDAFKNENIINPMRIARTETGSVQNWSRWESMAVAEVEKIEWLTAKDEAVRDLHKDLDGQIIVRGETFKTSDGRELRFPQDPRADADLVINCRCTYSAVVDWNPDEGF